MSTAARTSVIRSDAARLHVREIGSGRPILVLHGGPDLNHAYLLPDLDRLADIGRLVAYDQRGRGRSYTGEGPDDVSLDSEVADLDWVREWAGGGSVVLLGHSWGALLAMEYASRHPDRVERLILVNAAPASHTDMLALRQHLAAIRGPEVSAQMQAIRDSDAYHAGDFAADAAYSRLHFGGGLHRPEQLDQLIRQLRVGFSPEGIVAARAIEQRLYEETWIREDYDLGPRLRPLRIPTLILHGEHDLIPVQIARRTADAMPSARVVILPDCGHFAYLEQPDAVHAAVAGFIG